MQRVEYAFYLEHFGEKLSRAEFNIYSRRGLAFLKRVSLGRIKDYAEEDDVRCAVCEIAELMKELTERRGIANESNDGYSVSYRYAGDSIESEEQQYMKIALVWLPPSLFYRGV